MVDIPIKVFGELHDLRVFFDDSSELPSKRCISKQYKIDKRVMEVLQDEEASEEELRDAVFTDFMDNHEIKFLESSISANEDKNGNKKYTESSLSTFLVNYGKLCDEQETNQMRRIMRGLPVTTTSKPDLVPLRPGNNAGIDEIQIVMGEFKNAEKYTEELARTQMPHVLDWAYLLVTLRAWQACGRRLWFLFLWNSVLRLERQSSQHGWPVETIRPKTSRQFGGGNMLWSIGSSH